MNIPTITVAISRTLLTTFIFFLQLFFLGTYLANNI